MQHDVCTPGVELSAARIPSKKLYRYSVQNGTSFARPYVAGNAAFIKREFEKKGLKPSPTMIRPALMTTGKRIFLVFFLLSFLWRAQKSTMEVFEEMLSII